MTQEDRFQGIMRVLEDAKEHLTSSQICRSYMGQYTSSDTNSTCQILNVLAMAGMVSKIQKRRGQRSYYVAYKLVKK